jgi:hypothetical protein
MAYQRSWPLVVCSGLGFWQGAVRDRDDPVFAAATGGLPPSLGTGTLIGRSTVIQEPDYLSRHGLA